MNAPELTYERLRRADRATVVDGGDRAPRLRTRDVLGIAAENWPGMLAILLLSLAAATGYALFTKPVYEANFVVHVEDSTDPVRSVIGTGNNASLDVKSPASAEVEMIRSRRVLAGAVDRAQLFISAGPRYVPIIGWWLAQQSKGLSDPGIFGHGGWVSGTERIHVAKFDVPPMLQGTEFTVTAEETPGFTLRHPKLPTPLRGTVGVPLEAQVDGGKLTLLIDALDGRAGAQFTAVRHDYAETINKLQRDLRVVEKGRTSGVIEATLRDTNPSRLVAVLNDIGSIYLQQNARRKSGEADGPLQFVREQLPALKQQSEQAEAAYNRYRLRTGTVSVQDESKLLLTRSAELRANLQAAYQQRREMDTKYAANHPDMLALKAQIASWESQVKSMAAQLRELPGIQLDVAKLEKDVRLNDELYQQLRSRALQLQMISEGKLATVSLVDAAMKPSVPVQPKPVHVLGIGLAGGAVLAVLFALLRTSIRKAAWSAYDIEANTGLTVYGAIPKSPRTAGALGLAKTALPGAGRLPVLAKRPVSDPALIALGNLAATLQFGLRNSGRQRLLISGATAGVGRTFVAVHVANILAGAGHRVLLIDGDLNNGHVEKMLGISRAPGLAELLAGAVEAEEAVHSSHEPLLKVVPAGELVGAPPILRLMSQAPEIITRISADYDVVIIAGPPVLQAAETLFLAEAASNIVLVARPGSTQMEEVAECARRFAQWGHEVSGVVVNDLDVAQKYSGRFGRVYGNLAYPMGS